MGSARPENAKIWPEGVQLTELPEVSENNMPHLDVDITKTKLWMPVKDPAMLNVATAVTHNNLEMIASLLQKIIKMQLEQAEELEKLRSDICSLKTLLQTRLETHGEDIASETSQSSSTTSQSSALDSHQSAVGEVLNAGVVENDEEEGGVALGTPRRS
ncbi:hypothetical protein ACHAPT_010364 [Fusarium lateritium]